MKDIQTQIDKQCRAILIHLNNPKEIRAMVNQKDFFGKSAMSYME